MDVCLPKFDVRSDVTSFLPDNLSGLKKKFIQACLDNKFTGNVLMHLSKALNSIPRNLVIAKLCPNRKSFNRVTFLSSYLKE